MERNRKASMAIHICRGAETCWASSWYAQLADERILTSAMEKGLHEAAIRQFTAPAMWKSGEQRTLHRIRWRLMLAERYFKGLIAAATRRTYQTMPGEPYSVASGAPSTVESETNNNDTLYLTILTRL
jgi:hypothetical protein